MTTLILPVAGRSTRFPNMRPKWLLTMPDGQLMFEYALGGLNLENVERIVIVALKEHIDQFLRADKLKSLLCRFSDDVEILELDEPTSSQAHTISLAIDNLNITGPIFVKDCDNYFKSEIGNKNSVCYVDLHDCENTNPGNKSYIQIDELSFVTNIVEKKIISSTFCCGGYQFEDAENFNLIFKKIVQLTESDNEIYVSHIIYQMMLDGNDFYVEKCADFQDIGTIKEYNGIKKKSALIFCDVDGVLCENGSKFSNQGWDTPLILSNVETLRKLQSDQNIEIIITTSRPLFEKQRLAEKLESAGLKIKQYIMDLPHTQRVIINDFASTNHFPSATSINIPRNSTDLSTYLHWLVE